MAGNLRRAAEFVEMNLSQMGKDERRTRIGYKDQVRWSRSYFTSWECCVKKFAHVNGVVVDETKSMSPD